MYGKCTDKGRGEDETDGKIAENRIVQFCMKICTKCLKSRQNIRQNSEGA